MTEQELLSCLRRVSQDGDRDAFAALYRHYFPMVSRICRKWIADPMEAEDVCHDVFLEVLHKADQFDERRGNVTAWLAVKARSRCLDYLRRTRKLQVAELSEEAGEPANVSVEEEALSGCLYSMVESMMTQLPQSQQAALRAVYCHNLTQREAAEALDCPLGTLKSLVRYGLGNLRKKVDPSHVCGYTVKIG